MKGATMKASTTKHGYLIKALCDEAAALVELSDKGSSRSCPACRALGALAKNGATADARKAAKIITLIRIGKLAEARELCRLNNQ